MAGPGPVEGWSSLLLLERFRGGDERAADALFARHFGRLTALTRGRISVRLSRRIDAEEVALSAYRSFFAGAKAGRYGLGRGGDLWRLLSSIAVHKALKRIRREKAARRSVDVETPIGRSGEGRSIPARPGPTPEESLAMADELEWIGSRLDPLGRRVLELRLRGDRVSEIAGATGRSERTVRRTLAEIRAAMAGRLDGA